MDLLVCFLLSKNVLIRESLSRLQQLPLLSLSYPVTWPHHYWTVIPSLINIQILLNGCRHSFYCNDCSGSDANILAATWKFSANEYFHFLWYHRYCSKMFLTFLPLCLKESRALWASNFFYVKYEEAFGKILCVISLCLLHKPCFPQPEEPSWSYHCPGWEQWSQRRAFLGWWAIHRWVSCDNVTIASLMWQCDHC